MMFEIVNSSGAQRRWAAGWVTAAAARKRRRGGEMNGAVGGTMRRGKCVNRKVCRDGLPTEEGKLADLK